MSYRLFQCEECFLEFREETGIYLGYLQCPRCGERYHLRRTDNMVMDRHEIEEERWRKQQHIERKVADAEKLRQKTGFITWSDPRTTWQIEVEQL